MPPEQTDEQRAVARKAERIIRDYFVSVGVANEFALPKDYEDVVELLENAGLLTTSLVRCDECPNPAVSGTRLCHGHSALYSSEPYVYNPADF